MLIDCRQQHLLRVLVGDVPDHQRRACVIAWHDRMTILSIAGAPQSGTQLPAQILGQGVDTDHKGRLFGKVQASHQQARGPGPTSTAAPVRTGVRRRRTRSHALQSARRRLRSRQSCCHRHHQSGVHPLAPGGQPAVQQCPALNRWLYVMRMLYQDA
jgi:hypothetical protein